MNKHVKIFLTGNLDFLKYANFIAQQATALAICGSIQKFDHNTLLVYATGNSDDIENFIDTLYSSEDSSKIVNIEIKPLDEHKEFRGVFRIIQ